MPAVMSAAVSVYVSSCSNRIACDFRERPPTADDLPLVIRDPLQRAGLARPPAVTLGQLADTLRDLGHHGVGVVVLAVQLDKRLLVVDDFLIQIRPDLHRVALLGRSGQRVREQDDARVVVALGELDDLAADGQPAAVLVEVARVVHGDARRARCGILGQRVATGHRLDRDDAPVLTLAAHRRILRLFTGALRKKPSVIGSACSTPNGSEYVSSRNPTMPSSVRA